MSTAGISLLGATSKPEILRAAYTQISSIFAKRLLDEDVKLDLPMHGLSAEIDAENDLQVASTQRWKPPPDSFVELNMLHPVLQYCRSTDTCTSDCVSSSLKFALLSFVRLLCYGSAEKPGLRGEVDALLHQAFDMSEEVETSEECLTVVRRYVNNFIAAAKCSIVMSMYKSHWNKIWPEHDTAKYFAVYLVYRGSTDLASKLFPADSDSQIRASRLPVSSVCKGFMQGENLEPAFLIRVHAKVLGSFQKLFKTGNPYTRLPIDMLEWQLTFDEEKFAKILGLKTSEMSWPANLCEGQVHRFACVAFEVGHFDEATSPESKPSCPAPEALFKPALREPGLCHLYPSRSGAETGPDDMEKSVGGDFQRSNHSVAPHLTSCSD